MPDAAVLGREKRKTAGLRMTALVGDALEEDKEFYQGDMWAEGEDTDYETEPEQKDQFDSDFNDSEDSSDEDAASEDERPRRRAKKVVKSVKPPMPRRPRAKAATGSRPRRAVVMAGGVLRTVRASTKQKSKASAEVQQAEVKRMAQARKKARVRPVCKFTQEELLLEACETEESNSRWVQTMRRRAHESEASDAAPKRQRVFAERRRSAKGAPPTITFPLSEHFPEVLHHRSAPQPPTQAKCVVTGEPARYRDPKTRMPYANAAAFKELRRRWSAGEDLSRLLPPGVRVFDDLSGGEDDYAAASDDGLSDHSGEDGSAYGYGGEGA